MLEESRALVPCAFLITTRLPGETFYDSWNGLDGRTREQLAFEAGRCQAPFYAGYASISPLCAHHRLKTDFYRLLLGLECVAWWGRDPEAAAWLSGEYRRLFELLAVLEREVGA